MTAQGWPGYLDEFHTRYAGITERVLCRARAADGDAYDWLAAAIPTHARVLDVACGNGPLWTRLAAPDYVGVDVNMGELDAARRRGVGRLIRASVAALPIRDHSVGVVACSMALHVLTPLPDALAELGRVLALDGRMVATMPARGPMRTRDLPVVAGLLAALGRGLGYPNDDPLRTRLPSLLDQAGLRMVADDRRCYHFPLRGKADAELFLASLYLPDLAERRRRAAHTYMLGLVRTRTSLPVPVRRIITVSSRQ